MTAKNGTRRTTVPSFGREVNRVGEDITELRDDLRDIAIDTASAARAGVAEVKRGVQRRVKAVQKRGADASGMMRDYVSDNPMACVGIAVGAGLLLGLYLFRGRRLIP